MNKSLIGGIIAVIVLALGMFAIVKITASPTVIQEQNVPSNQKFGSLTGPVIPSPYLQWGGVTHWGAIEQFAIGTSTLCAIQSPAATSTLSHFSVIFNSLPSYTTTYELGYSATTQDSTSTAIVASFTPSGNINQFQATTTNTALQDGVVAPNSWVDFNVSTSTTGSNQATGECTATFDQM